MAQSSARSDTKARQAKYLAPSITPYYEEPLVLDHGKGCCLYDDEGREYLDFFGGILTVSVGHANPRVNAAVADQIAKLTHTSTLYITQPMVDLAERLAEITPGDLEVSFFTFQPTGLKPSPSGEELSAVRQGQAQLT